MIPELIPEVIENAELATLRDVVPTLIAKANAFEIADDAGYEKGGLVLNWLKTKTTDLEKIRKHFKQPIIESGKRIDNFFKEMSAPAKEAIGIVEDKMGVWYRIKKEEQQRAREEARKAEAERIKAEEERLRIQKDMEAKGVEVEEEDLPELPPAVIIPEAPQATGVTPRKTWNYSIMDGDKIPRIYLEPSRKLIMQSIRDGVREIPGMEIFQEVSFSKKRS